ncbi:HAD-IA family hydrolase [Turicibacter sanguinis]|uniref:HAD-IA family hydrolase n=2 Tax=Turicibacter sanguinis TaxID=154288 RepID=A0A9X4XC05_9FIRM|nr:HAD-IA family hydrolase [Turicibacter sanguinis]EFF65163.1 HAD hydrolase, family IA, variant 1 [Turicibacter sanguinis PC909]MCU7190585.1 HAD-IA family hydrolase [Turicibacter sanguinis]MTK20648.1 HAD-IA family hydrolase [Turicibacter sanguinis]MTK72889.1 HAD-IA family hydrolase [Turicibacter sanguinis]MTP78280.1 HAD-IA family hydrolase [Turicibacter sanguinis]
MMIKHIIWDFDGTLFDSYPGMVNAFLRALKKYEVEAEYDEVLKLFLNSEKTAVQYYQNQFLLGEELTEVYQDEKSHIDLSNMLPFPYAKEVCQRIKEAGRYNYILTHRGSTTYDILRKNGMVELFTEIVTKDNQFARKPDPEAIYYLLDKYQIHPKEAMIVGDREIEILLGQKAKVKTCFYESGNREPELQADYRVKSLEEVLTILNIES